MKRLDTAGIILAGVLLAVGIAQGSWIGPVNPDTDTFVDYAVAGPGDNAKIEYSVATNFTGKTVNSLWIVNGAGGANITLNGTLTLQSGAFFFTGQWGQVLQSSGVIDFNGQPGYMNLRTISLSIMPALTNTDPTAGLLLSGQGRFQSQSSTYQGPTTILSAPGFTGSYSDYVATSSTPLRLTPGTFYIPAQNRQRIPSVQGSGTVGGSNSDRSAHIGTLDGTAPLNTLLLNGGSISPGEWDGWTGAPFSSATISAQWTVSTTPARLELRDGSLNIKLAGTAAGQFGVLRAPNQATGGMTVIINPAAAVLNLTLAYVPVQGHSYVILNNEGGNAIDGTFKDLPEGTSFNLVSTADGRSYIFSISYVGGTGNDVVVTCLGVVPLGTVISIE